MDALEPKEESESNESKLLKASTPFFFFFHLKIFENRFSQRCCEYVDQLRRVGEKTPAE